MRTLTELLDFAKYTPNDHDSRFLMSGLFIIMVGPQLPTAGDAEQIRQAVKAINRRLKWNDQLPMGSTGLFASVEIVAADCPLENAIAIRVRQVNDEMRSGQIRAYEKYLAQFATALRKHFESTGVTGVWSVLEMRTIFTA
jgi:hypothetical protein